MPRLFLLPVLVLSVLFVIGCAPTVTVINNTTFPIRVLVQSGWSVQVLSPTPGESSSAEVLQGPYKSAAIPDAEWTAYAVTKRKYLNDQLANAENLSGAQLLAVIQQLKEIAQQMQQFNSAAGPEVACYGAINQDGGDATVTVTSGIDSKLRISCTTPVQK